VVGPNDAVANDAVANDPVADFQRCEHSPAPMPQRSAHTSYGFAAGEIEAVTFATVAGTPWTWSCASCTTTACAIVAPNRPPATACSGTVRLALSTFTIGIGDGPGDYDDSTTCAWVVLASGPVKVRFSAFDTEAGYDFVKLYDGTSASAPLLGSYSGSAVSAAVTSTGGAVTVVFTTDSDGFANRAGFAATLTPATFEAETKLIGTVPAALGDLRCIGRMTHLCVRSCHAAASDPIRRRRIVHYCRDLSGQNLTGQLPESITLLRMLSSMCALIGT
jgi:hypothetical protein